MSAAASGGAHKGTDDDIPEVVPGDSGFPPSSSAGTAPTATSQLTQSASQASNGDPSTPTASLDEAPCLAVRKTRDAEPAVEIMKMLSNTSKTGVSSSEPTTFLSRETQNDPKRSTAKDHENPAQQHKTKSLPDGAASSSSPRHADDEASPGYKYHVVDTGRPLDEKELRGESSAATNLQKDNENDLKSVSSESRHPTGDRGVASIGETTEEDEEAQKDSLAKYTPLHAGIEPSPPGRNILKPTPRLPLFQAECEKGSWPTVPPPVSFRGVPVSSPRSTFNFSCGAPNFHFCDAPTFPSQTVPTSFAAPSASPVSANANVRDTTFDQSLLSLNSQVSDQAPSREHSYGVLAKAFRGLTHDTCIICAPASLHRANAMAFEYVLRNHGNFVKDAGMREASNEVELLQTVFQGAKWLSNDDGTVSINLVDGGARVLVWASKIGVD
ncbi:MAG: hypothetical protein Q9159_004525 [Coniocarpon cinnabarinum]